MGDPVQITGSATCDGGATPVYRFLAVSPATGTALTLCSWQFSNVCNWDTSTLTEAGYYRLTVEARRQGTFVAEGSRARRYAVGPVCTGATLGASPSNATPGTNVTLTVTATCDPGVPTENRFLVKQSGKWTSLSPWQSSNTTNWNTSGYASGDQELAVYVRQPNYVIADWLTYKTYTLAGCSCDDGNPCTDDSCSSFGCQHSPNTAPCDDGNMCTNGDTCNAGICTGGSPTNCNDGNACTNDFCDPSFGCAWSVATGPCDDGNACTTGDTCSAGQCMNGSPTNCNDNNACTADNCNPVSGCYYTSICP